MSLLLAGQTFTDKFIHAFCWMLIHSLWQGMLLSLFAGIVVVCTKRSAPILRYRLLSGLFLVFIGAAAVSFSWQWPTGSETPDPLQQAFAMQKEAGRTQTGPGQEQSGTAETGIGRPAVYNNGNAGVPDRTDLSRPVTGNNNNAEMGSPSYPFWDRVAAYCNSHAYLLVMVWFVLFSIKCLRIAANIGYMQRLRHTGVQEPPAYWSARVRELSDRLQIKRRVALLESELAKVPMMAGFFKPVILIPIGLLAQLPADQVEAVLLHELAHIRRKDYLVNMLQHFAEIVFFFNPGVLWLSSLLRDEREHCCDDMAIGETKNKQQFIHALVSFQEYQLSDPSYAMGFPGSKKGHLLQRVRRIVYNDNKTLDMREKIFLLVCLFITGIMTLAFSRTADDTGNRQAEKNIAGGNVAGKNIEGKNDTLPGKSGIDFPSVDHYGRKEGIKILGDTVTYYSRGYEIVTMDSTVRAFYYDGARIPSEKIYQYVDLINQIIMEKNIRMQESRGPVPAGMTREEWDKIQSERDKQEADLARKIADNERYRSDLLEKAKDHIEISEITAPIPSVNVDPKIVPLTKDQLEAIQIGPYREKVVPLTIDRPEADTLPSEDARRMQELREYQGRLDAERQRLVEEQQRLNEEYARVAQETNRLTVQSLYRQSNIRLDTLQLQRLPEMAKASHREAMKQLEAMLRQSHEKTEREIQYRLKDEEQRWMQWYKESRLELYEPLQPEAPVKPSVLLKPAVQPLYYPTYKYVARPIKPLVSPVITSLLTSLLKEGIITDTLNVSFTLNAQMFVVNGIRQPDELRNKYKEKYFKEESGHIVYSRVGSGTRVELYRTKENL